MLSVRLPVLSTRPMLQKNRICHISESSRTQLVRITNQCESDLTARVNLFWRTCVSECVFDLYCVMSVMTHRAFEWMAGCKGPKRAAASSQTAGPRTGTCGPM